MRSRGNGTFNKVRCVIKSIFAFIATIVVAVACVTAPETKRKQVIVISEGEMNSLGEQSYKEILAKEGKI